MKIIEIKSLEIPEIKVIKFARFIDQRGYFTESYKKNDFENIDFMKGISFNQCNESYSKAHTIRGLHFQWNPYMGKLVRTLYGEMTDMVLDIRKNSPTFGKIICYKMPSYSIDNFCEWIWIPPGFAHGNFFYQETKIEYFCTGQYNSKCEAGISPFSEDIDWSICNIELYRDFIFYKNKYPLISDKDKDGLSLEKWSNDERSNNFIY